MNQEIGKILQGISEYLDLSGEPFKPRAYSRAASVIEELEEDVSYTYAKGGMKALNEIPGVGPSIAEKIEEYIKTGRIAYFDKIKKTAPVDVSALSSVEGLGPKKIKLLYEKLNIRTLDDLEKAARDGKIRNTAGFGQKTEENIIKGIEFLRSSEGRMPIGRALQLAEAIRKKIEAIPGIERAEIAGSIRRRKETAGDIDILALGDGEAAKRAMEEFVSQPEVESVYAKGETKSSVRLSIGIDADLRIIEKSSYGAGMLYFTGSKNHNIRVRKIAIEKGLKLNEYGLFRGEKSIAGKTEEEIYKELGMDFVPPEMREDNGEIEASISGKLPHLIETKDIKGDLQIQTNWSDGESSIEEYAEAAIKRGYQYILITDHSKRLSIANGLDEKRLIEQGREIDRVNKRLGDKGIAFKIFKGIECDILKDGSLDLSLDALASLDLVGASIHSYFNLPAEEQTDRMMKAMECPHVDIILHPTCRVLQQRKAIEADMDAVIKAAAKTRTALEIDAFPDRLDLKDEYIRKCVEHGVMLSIDSDAHLADHLKYVDLGVSQARRGWASRENIANAWPAEKCLKLIRKEP